MKKTITMIFSLLSILIVFAGCSVTSGSFDVTFGPIQYCSGQDKVHVQISCDYSDVNLRSAKCWWTFDGSSPADESENKNFENDEAGKCGFDIIIPSDFYEGQIKMLCEIEYKERLQIKKVSKIVTKSFSTKYHSLPEYGAVNLTLSKGKGFQKEYVLGMAPNNDVLIFKVSETGTLKVTFLENPEYFRVDNVDITPQELTDNTYTKAITSDHATINMSYTYSGFTDRNSPDFGKKTGEYLIVLE